MSVLDNPVLSALRGPHAPLAEVYGAAARYQPEVAPFHAIDGDAWDDLAVLAGPGRMAVLAGVDLKPPVGWEVTLDLPGVQLVDDGVTGRPDPEAVPLGPDDVPEMLALVERTQPGPFLTRTIETGRYLGIRRDGELIAMAGERMRPPGFTEISAVCTDERYRGQGLGTRLIRAVVANIRDRGETPFLHAAASNVGAIGLYRKMGFRLRMEPVFIGVTVPA